MSTAEKHRFRVYLAFGLVYILWGGTYLGMRVAVEHMPPYVMGTVRYLIAGPVMLAWCALSGRKVSLTAGDLRRVVIIGVLLLSVGNMGVAWAEEYLPTGLAALIVAIMPIWITLIELLFLRGRKVPGVAAVGLVLGFAGIVVLLWPKINSGFRMGRGEVTGLTILLVASLSWAAGSVLASQWTLNVDVLTSSAWQMSLGGVVNLTVALFSGGFHHVQITKAAVWALLYLIAGGSWIGFTAYSWLLEHVPTPKVATYAYVNPIVAVFLGWLLLSEAVDSYMAAGSVIIIAAVALVNSSKLRALRGTGQAKMQPVNVSGD